MSYQPEQELLERYANGKCTPSELARVEKWYANTGKKDVDSDHVKHEQLKNETWRIFYEANKPKVSKWLRPLAAAAALIGILTTIYFFEYRPKNDIKVDLVQEILPGTNQAILSLANGKRVDLSNLGSGALMSLDGTQIIKSGSGEIVFKVLDPQKSFNAPEVGQKMNSITTPHGGQYSILLPDGTRVTLNAGSSLYFPTSFTGLSNRRVKMTGEAYFEVAKDRDHPFIVNTGSQNVQVLGTHFNINAYPDEKVINTTLLEGSVKILSVDRVKRFFNDVVLKPGQQASLDGGKVSVSKANIGKVTAWKNGDFEFYYDDIETLLRQFSRWYNIDVQYIGKVPAFKFSGRISRNQNLSNALEILAFSNVKFKMEGRKLIILETQ